MPDYPVQELLFNDGEGIDYTDLNKAQRFLRAQLWDLGFGYRARGAGISEQSAGPNTGTVYTLGGGSPLTSATARTIINAPGVIAKYGSFSPPDGADPLLQAYLASYSELSTQLDVGDAQPRIDLISIRLDHVDSDVLDQESRTFKNYSTGSISTASLVKRRKVVLTKTVTKGTPAATPAIPATPVNYLPWCSVYVPAAHNAAIDVENIRDHLYPLGFNKIVQPVFGLGANVWASTAWSALTSGPGMQSTGAGVLHIAPPSDHKHSARLVRLGLMGLLTGCTVQLVRLNCDNTTSFGGETVLADISSDFTGGANQLYSAFETHANWARPIWLNGWTGGIAAITNPKASPNDARMGLLTVKITAPSSGKVVKFAEWDVAAC